MVLIPIIWSWKIYLNHFWFMVLRSHSNEVVKLDIAKFICDFFRINIMLTCISFVSCSYTFKTTILNLAWMEVAILFCSLWRIPEWNGFPNKKKCRAGLSVGNWLDHWSLSFAIAAISCEWQVVSPSCHVWRGAGARDRESYIINL